MGVLLAVEDSPSEQVVRRCFQILNPSVEIDAVLPKRGKTYLHSKRDELNSSAQNVRILLLVDLDNPASCGPTERSAWFPHGLSAGLIFRVAVVEVEAWVLASRSQLARYLGVTANKVPNHIEAIADPKQQLINLARRSRNRNIREDIVPAAGSTAHVGRDYNGRLLDFIQNHWDLEEASRNSQSLQKLADSIRSIPAI